MSKFDKYDPFLANNDYNEYLEAGIMVPNVKGGFKNKFDSDYSKYGQNENKKRAKAYSIHENYNYKSKTLEQSVPLNKDYDLFNQKDSSKTLLISAIKHHYTLKEISRTFINMNFLKKFETPEEFKETFIPEIMTKKPRITLDHFKTNKPEFRERSNTYFESNNSKINIVI